MISLEYKRPLTELADFHNHRSEWLNMDNWIVHSHDDEPHNCGKPKREHIRTVTKKMLFRLLFSQLITDTQLYGDSTPLDQNHC